MTSTELKQMTRERAVQWRNAALGIVDDFARGTWSHDKCLVVLRGLPGCGKSTFGDILASEFREEFHFSANMDMNGRKVRVCSGSLHQIQEGRDDPQARSLLQQDVVNSLRMSDVVIVDDLNVTMHECEWLSLEAESYWRSANYHGKIYTVTFACRNQSHAVALNARTWRPLSADAVRDLYRAFEAAEVEAVALPNCVVIDSNI